MLKPIIVLSLGIFFGHAAMSQKASFKWDEKTHNFKKASEGKQISHEFLFYNDGAKNIMITSVQTDEPGVVLEYSKNSIKPGNHGHVTVSFTRSTAGDFDFSIKVKTNGSDQNLRLKGEIVKVTLNDDE